MKIYTNIIREKHNNDNSSKNVGKKSWEIKKEEWLQKYASRILRIWSQWQTPFGVTSDYIVHIKTELANFYEDPLKKMFIESAY